MPKALLVILLFTLSFFVSAQNYTNCIEQQGLGKVEWSSDATSIYVRATIFGSSAGWGAVGFNKIGEKMVGASIYLGNEQQISTVVLITIRMETSSTTCRCHL